MFGMVVPGPWLLAGGFLLLVLLLLAGLLKWLGRRPRQTTRPSSKLTIDVRTLNQAGPPSEGPRLEFYGTPVRLAAIVVAPVGRTGELPPAAVLPGVIEHVVPGLTQVVARHRPKIYRWPIQLSTQGFTQSFFNHAALPGTRGKGSPWSSIAGRFQIGDRSFLLGLVCVAERPNALSQVAIQHEGQWQDVLRFHDA